MLKYTVRILAATAIYACSVFSAFADNEHYHSQSPGTEAFAAQMTLDLEVVISEAAAITDYSFTPPESNRPDHGIRINVSQLTGWGNPPSIMDCLMRLSHENGSRFTITINHPAKTIELVYL
ncbi:hypothetical protein [Marinimicrobium sp. ABcell2]|uniref:hypothetical protein n=1 Tax=Marinimicrobium sp. ABcell2 TaxID=3069751 RepID=UPI0027B724E0|nr:hypothetical protein [Marinimicrobium sp. ABcell2]MDQ2078526.1 hypothetical protein [Marinimicrobium sp. ABcell2]